MKNSLKTSILCSAAVILLLASCSDESKPEKGPDETLPVVPEETRELTYADTVPEDLSFRDGKFRIGYATQFKTDGDIIANECAPVFDKDSDIVDTAVYERNRFVEEQLGITFEAELLCDYYSDASDVIMKYLQAGDCPFDALDICYGEMLGLARADALIDLNTVSSLVLSHEWWDQNALNNYSLGSKNLYFASGKINYVDDYAAHCMFFNKDLCTDLQLDTPYQAVRNGKWTYDLFLSYIKQFGRDVDGNGKYNEVDEYGYSDIDMSHFLSGAGIIYITFAKDGSPVLGDDDRFYDYVNHLMEDIYDRNNKYVYIQGEGRGHPYIGIDLFQKRQCFFTPLMVGRCMMTRYGMEDDFGMVPLPKWEEAQETYYTDVSSAHGTAYGIMSNYENPEMVGWVLDLMGYYSQDTIYPAAIEKQVQTKATRDDESAEMLDIIFSNQLFQMIGGDFSSIVINVSQMGRNSMSSQLEKYRKQILKGLEDIPEHFEY